MARPIATLLLASLILGTGTQALTRFDPTCTLPTTSVNFISSPDYRGTLDILWSCIFTLIACTWTIQHLNIPEQRDHATKKKVKLYQIWYTAKSFWNNFKWMLFTMVAPEFILGKAVCDFIVVRDLKKKVDKMKKEGKIADHEERGLSHGFFAVMGGFRVLLHDDTQEREEIQRQENTLTGEKQGDIQRTEKLDDGETQGSRTNQVRQTSLEWDHPEISGSWILPPEILLWLRENDKISRLPNITEKEIHDKSKANIFVKALAVLQVFWVCVQVIVRSIRGLAISQLEVVVTAFSVCAVITYTFLIPKPQGVQVPMRPIVLRPEVFELVPDTKWFLLRTFFAPTVHGWVAFKTEKVMAIRNDSVPTERYSLLRSYPAAMGVGSLIFGAIHIAGWNLTFPTPIEQELWRIASVIITCLPLVAYAIFFATYFLVDGLVDESHSSWEIPFVLWALGSGVIYIIARLFLLVETFRSLGFLPPDAFVATWVSNIPSVG